jgi:hypothetical protein
MKRRDFISKLVGGVATAAAVRSWPFRVFSFPSQVAPSPDYMKLRDISLLDLEPVVRPLYDVYGIIQSSKLDAPQLFLVRALAHFCVES